MREIKFRAWVEHESSSEELNSIYPYMQENPEFHGSINEIFKENSIEPENPYACKITYMQYTGLKDKNGRDIYEGDIVDYIVFDHFDRDTQHRGIVKWDKQEAAYYLANVDGSDFHGSYIHYLGWVSCRDPELEVIGNIYENPGLLVKSNVS